MSTKEAKNDVAVEKIVENDDVDPKADIKGTKRPADVSKVVDNSNNGYIFVQIMFVLLQSQAYLF